MFDWNDEELANIIWGEGGESDDHIVPYPEINEDVSNNKEFNQEASTTKLTELKRPEAKTDFYERKLGSSSNLDNSVELPVSGYGTHAWPDLSLSSSAKIDQGSLGTEVSKNLRELGKFSSRIGESKQHEKDAEIFQSANEGKEQGDFVDYEWANIGSFDDLDRIFSNDDPIFGHVSLDNSNDLWSSKDVTNDPAPLPLDTPSSSGALRNGTDPLEIKEEYVQCNGDKSLDLSYEKIGIPASQVLQNSCTITGNAGNDGVRSKPTEKERQVFRQKNLLKTRKKSQVKQEENNLQDFYGNWSPSAAPARQFENELSPSVIQSSPSPILGQQKQIQGAETLFQNIVNPYVASSVYENLTGTYPAMPMLSQTSSGDLRQQPVLSGYKVSPGTVNSVKNTVDSVKPQIMTPQEKIEKLRRRQQMQAMIAIQKQRQQLGHQVPSNSKSSTQKCPPKIPSHLSDDGTDEDLRILPAPDPPIEQDDSNTMSVAVGNDFVEDTIFYQLQDIISKLDIKIRLCIRDSLIRLAQSATQRHYASDTNSTNKSSRDELEFVAREESNKQNRYARMPDVETETNPIDRTVAHLLFHSPVELTQNYSDNLESPVSTKVQCESKAANLVNFPMSCLPDEDSKNNQQLSHLGLKNSWFDTQSMDQIRNSPCVDTSENASNTQELEASQ
ncbi:protein LNK2 [Vigna radiata var. radiata]|uniref:Protein LNK2 n=1 Tax=Vigna radiata var. radiata TaxID=3916 RepID=A0A1S3U561_VIGRR|nr:protein LNK2 [Vigna radiata var. radiata]XP_014501134.1 protein LNK2 [Vigna radiata var. radiata]XP_014501135.1 protein LNK2 [Vigna radiata var. radiata]